MAIKYSQSKQNRNLSLFDVTDLTEEQSWEWLKKLRWGDGKETKCPDCLCIAEHYFIKTRKQWTCKKCSHRFSVTSSSPFASHKLSLRKILCLIYSFVSASQGLSANSFHAEFGTTLKTVFHNLGKVREILYETTDRSPLEGLVHIDCAHFCGKPRRGNTRKKTDSFVINNKLRSRKDSIVPNVKTHPETWNIQKLKKRRILLALSQADPDSYEGKGSNRTLYFVLEKENGDTIIPIIKKYVEKSALIHTDFGNAFNRIELDIGNHHLKVNHSVQYQDSEGVNNNYAESFFSRLRRAEFGTYNGMRPQYFAFYAAEFSWRDAMKKTSLRDKFEDVIIKAFSREKSKAFCNYNHGHRLNFEYVM
jgi:transposase-like protein